MVRTALILLTVFFGVMKPSLDPMPDTPQMFYWPEMWKQQQFSGNFRMDCWQDDSFLLSCTVQGSEPEIGYPYHYGTILGINDTVKVQVYLDNRSTQDYARGSEAPQIWVYPVLYDTYTDVFTNQPLADTTVFHYKFENWIDIRSGIITTCPDTIYTRKLHANVYPRAMLFSVWGVSAGEFRVILKTTTNLPQGIIAIVDNPNSIFTMATGQHILDTLNAYATIATNALFRREFTLFNSYVDNMFGINAQCLPGWALKYSGYIALGDTTNARSAIDSLLNNADNRLDPFIPDTSRETPYHRLWLKNYTHNYRYEAWKLRNPEQARLVRFM